MAVQVAVSEHARSARADVHVHVPSFVVLLFSLLARVHACTQGMRACTRNLEVDTGGEILLAGTARRLVAAPGVHLLVEVRHATEQRHHGDHHGYFARRLWCWLCVPRAHARISQPQVNHHPAS